VVDLCIPRRQVTRRAPSRVYTHEAGFARRGARGPRFHYRDVARAYRRPPYGWPSGGPHPNVRITTIASNRFDFGATASLGAELIDELKSASLAGDERLRQGPPQREQNVYAGSSFHTARNTPPRRNPFLTTFSA
jgi:hypothetical protein